MTSRSDPARSHALSLVVGGKRCKIPKVQKSNPIQSKSVYVTSRDKVRHQVRTLLLNQPKPPTMLPRRNDDDKDSISNTENETNLRAPHNFLFDHFFLEKKRREKWLEFWRK
jgi:hypothetical protein